jgi:hypothetical protein
MMNCSNRSTSARDNFGEPFNYVRRQRESTPNARQRNIPIRRKIVASTPERIVDYVNAETIKWDKVIKDAPITLE